MDNVVIHRPNPTVEVNLTASQWQLYTISMNCVNAAQSLNARMNKLFRTCSNPEEIEVGMEPIQSMYSSYGAYDTEPSCVIRQIIREVYGEDSV